MLTPNEIAALEHHLGIFLSTAASPVVRAAAWNAICAMADRGGLAVVRHAAATTVSNAAGAIALEAGEVAVLRAIATRVATKQGVKAGMTMAVEAFIPRLVANFAICPKGPGPIIGATVIITLLMTSGDVYAAVRDAENYQMYLMKYSDFLARRIAQGHMERGGKIEPPMTFEEFQRVPYFQTQIFAR